MIIYRNMHTKFYLVVKILNIKSKEQIRCYALSRCILETEIYKRVYHTLVALNIGTIIYC